MNLLKVFFFFSLFSYHAIGQDKISSFQIIPETKYLLYNNENIELSHKIDFIVVNSLSKSLQSLVEKIRTEVEFPNNSNISDNKSTSIFLEILINGAEIDKGKENGEQGYVLEIVEKNKIVLIKIKSASENGVYYGLQTLRQLFFYEKKKLFLRKAFIKDWPSIKRRGLIFGYNHEAIPEILPLISKLKLNFFQDVGIRKNFKNRVFLQNKIHDICDLNFIEICAHLGYKNMLIGTNINQVINYYKQKYDLGYRSFTINFDDTKLKDEKEALLVAKKHVFVINSLYDYFYKLDKNVKFIICPIVYAGIPSRGFFHAPTSTGKTYLNFLKINTPKNIPIFWTGDEGIWSKNITTLGAREYNKLIGRKAFIWDNDTLHFSNQNKLLSGRDKFLFTEIDGYVANLNEKEIDFIKKKKNLYKIIISIAMYTWNPEKYDHNKSAEIIEKLAKELI